MKLTLPRRRWLVLAACLAVICVMYGVDAQRYQRMLARYERVRVGMSPSEVRAAIGQPSVVVPPVPPPFIDEDRLRATGGEQRVRAKASDMSGDTWIDRGMTMDVWYTDGKVLDKSLYKRSFATYWVDRLPLPFGYCLKPRSFHWWLLLVAITGLAITVGEMKLWRRLRWLRWDVRW
jgi:hypothetical protein